MTNNAIPLSLYIHIPWCEHKCPYCDFNSHDNLSLFDEQKYIDALIADLKLDLAQFLAEKSQRDREIHTIFIGGGTPSLLSGQAFARLLSDIRQYINVSAQAEITLEANPSSAEQAQFKTYRETGINRLSIGTQSYNQNHLKRIGRIHSSEEAIEAAESAKRAGFTNFNIDLMFALPKQNLQEAMTDIKTAVSLRPSHISCYQLTLESNTAFYQNPPKLPDNEQAWEIQRAIQNELKCADFEQYEVSAYSRAGKQCQHNLNYWQFGDYLGIGAGAHGKITDASNNQISRYWKQKHPKHYLANAGSKERLGETIEVVKDQRPFEFMLNALRLRNGFLLNTFESRTLMSSDTISHILEQHANKSLITINQQRIKPTEKGYRFIDNLLDDYLN